MGEYHPNIGVISQFINVFISTNVIQVSITKFLSISSSPGSFSRLERLKTYEYFPKKSGSINRHDKIGFGNLIRLIEQRYKKDHRLT